MYNVDSSGENHQLSIICQMYRTLLSFLKKIPADRTDDVKIKEKFLLGSYSSRYFTIIVVPVIHSLFKCSILLGFGGGATMNHAESWGGKGLVK